jgi:hypothetical protein
LERAVTLHPALALLALATALPCSAQEHFERGSLRSLFDGATLAGWVEHGGRYDGDADWRVEDGAMVGREGPGHAGGLIYTDRPYANFVFATDVRITWPFDSGIFVRMVPPALGLKGAQVTLDYRPDGEVGAIYADGYLQHDETSKAKWRRDDWNRVEVLCLGPAFHLTVWLNGEQITDYVLKDPAGFAATGRIGLQVHGGRDDPPGSAVRFRDVGILELPDFDPELFTCDERGSLSPTAAAVEAGWRALFDGRSLAGWEPVGGESAPAAARGGALSFDCPDRGVLATTAEYEDFDLRLDFRIAPAARAALWLRAPRGSADRTAARALIPLGDDGQRADERVRPWQLAGSLYGSVPPAERDAVRPAGAWNTLEVRCAGTRIATRLNGVELYDVDTSKLEVEAGEARPFGERAARGVIGVEVAGALAARGGCLELRNLFLRPR